MGDVFSSSSDKAVHKDEMQVLGEPPLPPLAALAPKTKRRLYNYYHARDVSGEVTDPSTGGIWTTINLEHVAEHFKEVQQFLDYRKRNDLDAELEPDGGPVYLLGPYYDDYGPLGAMLKLHIRVLPSEKVLDWTSFKGKSSLSR